MIGDDDGRSEPQFGYRGVGERQEPFFEDLRSSGAMATRRKRKPLIRTFLVGAAIILFCGFVIIAYRRHPVVASGQLSIITAEMAPVKVKPDNPGGMNIPYQDTTVYDELARHGKTKPGSNEVEHLLQPPEEPLPTPEQPKAVEPAFPPAADEKPPLQQAKIEPGPPAVEAPVENDNDAALAPTPAPQATKLPSPPAAAADNASDDAAPPASIPKAAPKQPATILKVKPPGTGTIQLGAFRDEAGANAEWKRLQSQHSDQLGSLSPTVSRVDLGDKGIWYRLKAGPIGGDSAKHTCATLKAANVSCLVSQR